LIAATVRFEPSNDVGIQTHSYGFLRWAIEPSHFGSTPIENRRNVREINVRVSFCGDGALFASAPYHARADALERLLGYVDFRKALLTGELADFTCLAGTMVQEVYDTHPAIREACDRSISRHAETLQPDIAEAMRKYGVTGEWTARSLALYTQAVLQGSFILAKAKGGPAVAGECLDHLRRYIEMLFQQEGSTT
jgi:hypothetical protein